MIFTAAVEGTPDEAALRKIIELAGHELGQVYGRSGKAQILRSLNGYNSAARFSPWVVMVDLDSEACAVEAARQWLPNREPNMCFRIAVRELEAWLMADRERFSSFFGVSIDSVPLSPENLPDAKQTLINVVRRSRRAAIRADMVPDHTLGQTIGPAYTTRLIEFINAPAGWRAEVASQNAISLARAMKAIQSYNG